MKPKSLSRQADREAQGRFIRYHRGLMNGMSPGETIVFADAVHPESRSRPVHARVIRPEMPTTRSMTGCRRLDTHAAFDLEKMKIMMAGGERSDAGTTLRLPGKPEWARPRHWVIHVYPDNARHHHAKTPGPFLDRPDCRIRLHFPPPHALHLNPIGRLWRVMHRHVTHNRFHPDFRFAKAIMDFFNRTLARKWEVVTETVTDNCQAITHAGLRWSTPRDAA